MVHYGATTVGGKKKKEIRHDLLFFSFPTLPKKKFPLPSLSQFANQI
jgi:hypothetical protein